MSLDFLGTQAFFAILTVDARAGKGNEIWQLHSQIAKTCIFMSAQSLDKKIGPPTLPGSRDRKPDENRNYWPGGVW